MWVNCPSLCNIARLGARLARPPPALHCSLLSTPECVILCELLTPKTDFNSINVKHFLDLIPPPEFWNDSAAKFHTLESFLGCLHVIVNGDEARLNLLKLF